MKPRALALLLLAWFVAVSLLALWRMRLAGWFLLAGLIFSTSLFAYDATTRNYQMHAEDLHATGHQKTFHYATWFWYDESWVRH